CDEIGNMSVGISGHPLYGKDAIANELVSIVWMRRAKLVAAARSSCAVVSATSRLLRPSDATPSAPITVSLFVSQTGTATPLSSARRQEYLARRSRSICPAS